MLAYVHDCGFSTALVDGSGRCCVRDKWRRRSRTSVGAIGGRFVVTAIAGFWLQVEDTSTKATLGVEIRRSGEAPTVDSVPGACRCRLLSATSTLEPTCTLSWAETWNLEERLAISCLSAARPRRLAPLLESLRVLTTSSLDLHLGMGMWRWIAMGVDAKNIGCVLLSIE